MRHGETPKTWRYLEVQFQVIPKWISGYGGFPLKGVSQNYPGQKKRFSIENIFKWIHYFKKLSYRTIVNEGL